MEVGVGARFLEQCAKVEVRTVKAPQQPLSRLESSHWSRCAPPSVCHWWSGQSTCIQSNRKVAKVEPRPSSSDLEPLMSPSPMSRTRPRNCLQPVLSAKCTSISHTCANQQQRSAHPQRTSVSKGSTGSGVAACCCCCSCWHFSFVVVSFEVRSLVPHPLLLNALPIPCCMLCFGNKTHQGSDPIAFTTTNNMLGVSQKPANICGWHALDGDMNPWEAVAVSLVLQCTAVACSGCNAPR